MFGIYDFQSHSKRIHRLIALDASKYFTDDNGLEKILRILFKGYKD